MHKKGRLTRIRVTPQMEIVPGRASIVNRSAC